MTYNGYTAPHPVGIEVRADMLEITAGWPDEARVNKELAFALSTVDENDPDSLKWLACCIAAKLDYLNSKETTCVT